MRDLMTCSLPARTITLTVVATLALSFAACRDRIAEPYPTGEADHSGFFRRPWRGDLVRPPSNDDEVQDVEDRYLEILNEVSQRHAEILDRNPPAEVLHEMELVFFSLGRTFELADFYKAAVERNPTGPLRARLAYLYQRLGMDTEALEQAELAVRGLPDDPFGHFVLGFCYGQRSGDDISVLPQARDAFVRVLELDPEFSLYGGFNAETLRSEIEAIEGLLGRENEDNHEDHAHVHGDDGSADPDSHAPH